MRHPGVLALVRQRLDELVAGYVTLPDLDGFLVPPGLGERSGILGALALAASAGE